MSPIRTSILSKISVTNDPQVLRILLIAGGFLSMIGGLYLSLLVSSVHCPIWLGPVAGLIPFIIGIGTGLFPIFRKNLFELAFLSFILFYLSVIFLAYLNRLSFPFAVSILITHLFFALSFRKLSEFAIFGMSSILLFTLCTLFFPNLEISRRTFILIICLITIVAGLYLWMQEGAYKRIQQNGRLLGNILDQTGEALFLLDDPAETLLYHNVLAERYIKDTVSQPVYNAEALFDWLQQSPKSLLAGINGESQIIRNVVSIQNLKGEDRSYELLVSKVQQTDGTFTLLKLRDITDISQQEQFLSQDLSFNEGLIEAIPDMLITIDAFGVIQNIRSPRYFEQLNPIDQFLDRHFSELTNKVMAAIKQKEAIQLLEKVQKSGELQQMEFITKIETESRHFDLRMVGLPSGDEFLVIIRDISNLKQVENALKQSEENYREIFNAGTDGVLILHPESLEPVEANRVAIELLGYSVEELAKIPLPNLCAYPESKEMQAFLAKSRQGNNQSLECTLARKEGDWVELEITAKLTVLGGQFRLMLILRDITERIEFTQRIGRYTDLFQSADIGMMILHLDELANDKSLRFVTCNRHAELLLGKTSSQIAGKYIDDVLPNWRMLKMPDKMAGVVRSKEAVVVEDLRYHDRELQPQYWRTKLSPLPGQYVGVLFEKVTEQKEREMRLIRSEQRFKDLFQGSPEAIFVCNLDGGILDANPAACRLQLSHLDHLIQKSLHDLTPQEYLTEFEKRFTALVNGELQYLESYILDSRKRVIPVEIRGRQFELDGMAALILHVADITERRTAEDRLRLFRSLINQSSDAIYVVDFTTGQLVDFNERMPASLGYTNNEMRNLSLYDFSLSPQHSKLQPEDVKHLTASGSTIYVGRHKRKDNTSFPVEVNLGHVSVQRKDYLVGVARDITERVHSEAALRQSEQKYRTLVERMNEGLLLTDNDETILFVNTRMCEILGVQKEALLGYRTFDVLSNGDVESKSLIQKKSALRRQGISDQYELRLKKPNGDVLWVLVAGAPYVDSNSDLLGTIAIITDITNRKKTELKLQEKNNELDAFVYKASHDLKGPLASIIGVTNIAREEVSDQASIRYFDLISKSTKRLDNILLELIDVTRINKADLHMEKIDVEGMVDEIINSLKHQPKSEHLTFSKEIHLSNGFMTDKKLLLSVLQNLIVNSINYHNPSALNPFVKIKVIENHDRVQFRVIDNGQGIPQRIQHKVFEMFYRGNTRSKGSGLGLYIVKSAIEKLQGSCEIQSEEGKGTVFAFTLPMYLNQDEIV